MKIHLATDHAGFAHKEALKEYFISQGIEVIDHGAVTLVENDDYPDYILECAEAIADDLENSRGIIFGGSGQGEAMCANRIGGIRAVVYYGYSDEIIKLSREHNNANILSIGARFVTPEESIKAVTLWLETPFSNEERHIRRINKY